MKDLRKWAAKLKGEVVVVALAMKHPRTPWYAKLLGAGIVAYALSPIDLVPDFIPVLGLLDDVILVPMGIRLLLTMIPNDVHEECRHRAQEMERGPRSLAGALLVILVWILLALAGMAYFFTHFTII